MRISVSLFSCRKKEKLFETAQALGRAGADYLHLDYRHDVEPPIPLDAVSRIQEISGRPLDVHLITERLEPRDIEVLNRERVAFCSVQYEPLLEKEALGLGRRFHGRWGIAIATDTPLEVIEPFLGTITFVNLMATVPGKSGGVFDRRNFRKIHEVKEQHPGLKIQVDGGVNYTIGRALRAAKVDILVSGSFVINGNGYANNIAYLNLGEDPAKVFVDYIMVPANSLPILPPDSRFQDVVCRISSGKMGAAFVVNDRGILEGIIADGDIRRAFMTYGAQVVEKTARDIMNPRPFKSSPQEPLTNLFERLNGAGPGVMVIPVCGDRQELLGALDLHETFGGY